MRQPNDTYLLNVWQNPMTLGGDIMDPNVYPGVYYYSYNGL